MSEIKNRALYEEALDVIRRTYGRNAQFREGQYEAIEATMTNKRTLVVQKTGWGKSLVYFTCTKLFRKHGRGMTMVISPLLVLMQNQMEMASRMGLRCAALNSTIREDEEREAVLADMTEDRLDLIFITPETLLREEVQSRLSSMRLGLFVVDEAHCISDWGHDFRLDYSKLGRIISGVFSSTAVLATTATANDRVIRDIQEQLGRDVFVSRGPLTRDSLHIQVLHLSESTERYGWLLENLPKLPGTGIIYCLDRRDCDYLTAFLQENGIRAMSYYSRETLKGEEKNDAAMEAFGKNSIKAIVATIKLGMGYDKGDISFVIHYQSPSNIVAWYQQIGRAGRNLTDAYVFLMTGKEDARINEYFINTAFPSREEAEQVIACVGNADGIMKRDIIDGVNLRNSRIEKTLYFLENEGFIRKEKINGRLQYFITPKRFVYNDAHYRAVMDTRYDEMREMHELTTTKACLSRFAVNCLDDHTACNCGKCRNCTGRDIFPGLTLSQVSVQKAADFVNRQNLFIEPRKRWPDGKTIREQLVQGICLSRYGSPGYGEMVMRGRNPERGKPAYDDQLAALSAVRLAPEVEFYYIEAVTYIPSARNDAVRNFAEELARRLHLPCLTLLEKHPKAVQSDMENSAFQCRNAWETYQVIDTDIPKRLLLVDDLIDSKWTMTVCGAKLLRSGCSVVYPFALADSSREAI